MVVLKVNVTGYRSARGIERWMATAVVTKRVTAKMPHTTVNPTVEIAATAKMIVKANRVGALGYIRVSWSITNFRHFWRNRRGTPSARGRLRERMRSTALRP